MQRYGVGAVVIVAVLVIAYFFVGDPRTFRIRQQFISQLESQLPGSSVDITQMTHGEKGYAISVAVHHDASTTLTTFNLASDGFGHLTCSTVGTLGPINGPISISIAE